MPALIVWAVLLAAIAAPLLVDGVGMFLMAWASLALLAYIVFGVMGTS